MKAVVLCKNCGMPVNRHRALKFCTNGKTKYEPVEAKPPVTTAVENVTAHIVAARRAKAEKMVVLLKQYKIKKADVLLMGKEQWLMLAKAANVAAPSLETQQIVKDLMGCAT
jgi:hypothetical protein